jgi:nucleoside-diphosphate-sugar epimerase
MYMDDAVKATIDIMRAPPNQVKIRSSYNLDGFSVTPETMYNSIKKHVPDFEISYKPDFRQAIADSWPSSIDDSEARKDWGWQHAYNLDDMTDRMLKELQKL